MEAGSAETAVADDGASPARQGPSLASSPLAPPRATSEKMVVTVSGRQSPGALADVMHVLGTASPSKLIDFGQLVIHGRFTATAVLAPADSADADADARASADAFRGIIVRAHSVGFQVDFDAASRSLGPPARPGSSASLCSALSTSTSSLATTRAAPDTDDYIITLFSPGRIPARLVADATRAIAAAGANISSINRLTDEGDDYMCLELVVAAARDEATIEALRRSLFALGRATASSDVAMQPARVTRMARRIVVFDLSWTLVRCDAVDVLLEAAGLSAGDDGRAAYRSGRMSGPDWLRARVALLKGADADAVNAAAVGRMAYTDGARQLCKGLKRLGCRLAVVSSGSRKIAEQAKEDLGLDYAFGNTFEMDASRRFTGVVSEPVVDADRKADLVEMLAMQEGVDAEQVVAVGDGPVSSKMLSAAGMSVAFDQPDSVEGVQSGRISSKSLASVFYLLGVTGRDFRELLEPREL
jgi:phosphoserine phosphatase